MDREYYDTDRKTGKRGLWRFEGRNLTWVHVGTCRVYNHGVRIGRGVQFTLETDNAGRRHDISVVFTAEQAASFYTKMVMGMIGKATAIAAEATNVWRVTGKRRERALYCDSGVKISVRCDRLDDTDRTTMIMRLRLPYGKDGYDWTFYGDSNKPAQPLDFVNNFATAIDNAEAWNAASPA